MKQLGKRLLAGGLASLMLAAAVPATAAQAATPFSTVALGDSITTGYNIADSYRIPYAEIVSGYYGGTLANYAENGATSADLLQKLQDPAVQASVSGADLVLVTIGANDVMQPVLQNEYIDAAGYNSLSAMINDLRQKGEKDAMLQLRITMYLDKVMPDNITNCRANISQIAQQLRALNPTARIVFQTVYNPLNMLDDDTTLASSGTVEVLRAHVNRYLEGIPDNEIYTYGVNDAIRDLPGVQVAEVADIHETLLRHAYYYTEIKNVDVHPNGIGHLAIAQRVIDLVGASAAADGSGLRMRQAYQNTGAANSLRDISAQLDAEVCQTALWNTMGDVNCDGKLDITDASLVLKQYAAAAASSEPVLSGLDLVAADWDGNQIVEIQDVSALLSTYARRAAGIE